MNALLGLGRIAACLLVWIAAASGQQTAPGPAPAPGPATLGPGRWFGPNGLPAHLRQLPDPPPVAPDGLRAGLLDADRVPVLPGAADYPQQAAAPVLIDVKLPPSVTGTGFAEYFQYQLPTDYDPAGPLRPLLVAYHGFGTSAASVASQTTLDEWCEARGWIYLSVTGLDDKLFGSPLCQRHVEVAIEWMLDEWTIDPDRIAMVGFSMGAGVVANFAATHLDPGGIMIAAVGLVAGSFDWTMTWHGEPAVQPWLEHAFNFGGPPSAGAFAYQRASVLHFDPLSYPPTPGLLVDGATLGTNLSTVPTYLAWDAGDTIADLPYQSGALAKLLAQLGGTVETREVAGTVNPSDGKSATHSWAVLDEEDLFDFLDGRRVDRVPDVVSAKVAEEAAVSYLRVEPRTPDAFAELRAKLDPAGAVAVEGVTNVGELDLRMGLTGLDQQWPLILSAHVSDPAGLRLRVTFAGTPSGYFVDAQGAPLPGVDWEPASASASVDLGAGAVSPLHVWGADWETGLTMLPDPIAPGQAFELGVDSESPWGVTWLVLSGAQSLLTLPGGRVILVSLVPPMLLLPLPLDENGDRTVKGAIPPFGGITGITLHLQGAVIQPGAGLVTLTNPVALDIQ